MFEDDFKDFKSLVEARKFWNNIQIVVLKEYFGVSSDNALANRLNLSRSFICDIKYGRKNFSFISVSKHVIKLSDVAAAKFKQAFTMSHVASLYFVDN